MPVYALDKVKRTVAGQKIVDFGDIDGAKVKSLTTAVSDGIRTATVTYEDAANTEKTLTFDYVDPGDQHYPTYVDAAGVAGTANAITLTPSPAITAYAVGQAYLFLPESNSTGAVTVNVSGQGAKQLHVGSSQAGAGDIVSGRPYVIVYDGTQFAVPGVSEASDSRRGIVELATNSEVDSGSDTGKAVTPAGLKRRIDTRAPLASPALTGNPTAPTQTAGNDSTRIATTAFVQDAADIHGLTTFTPTSDDFIPGSDESATGDPNRKAKFKDWIKTLGTFANSTNYTLKTNASGEVGIAELPFEEEQHTLTWDLSSTSFYNTQPSNNWTRDQSVRWNVPGGKAYSIHLSIASMTTDVGELNSSYWTFNMSLRGNKDDIVSISSRLFSSILYARSGGPTLANKGTSFYTDAVLTASGQSAPMDSAPSLTERPNIGVRISPRFDDDGLTNTQRNAEIAAFRSKSLSLVLAARWFPVVLAS